MKNHTPHISRPTPGVGGIQQIYKFPNGYGASVVCHPFSYGGDEGKWELAVVTFSGDDWRLTYKTPITDDVLGYLSDEEVQQTLDAIEALPSIKEAA